MVLIDFPSLRDYLVNNKIGVNPNPYHKIDNYDDDDISDEFDTKLAAIGLHLSQGQKYYMQPDYHALRSRRWGLNVLARRANARREDAGKTTYWEAYSLAQHVN